MTFCASDICFPRREKNAFLTGFQNPRTPSYFSNIHLLKRCQIAHNFRLALPPSGISITLGKEARRGGLAYVYDLIDVFRPPFRRHFLRYWFSPFDAGEEVGPNLPNRGNQALEYEAHNKVG